MDFWLTDLEAEFFVLAWLLKNRSRARSPLKSSMYSAGFIFCCCIYCYSSICNLFSFFFYTYFPFQKSLVTLSRIVTIFCIAWNVFSSVCGRTTFFFLPPVSAIGLEPPLSETLLEMFTYLLTSSRHFKMHARVYVYACCVHMCARLCMCACMRVIACACVCVSVYVCLW